jgi:hypothetical protein
VILGWVVVSNLQDYRELRKDRVARVSEVRKRLHEFEQEALDFHTSEFQMQKVLSVVGSLSTLGRELHFLQACEYIAFEYQEPFVALRKACTNLNFDKQGHQVLDHADPLCLVIRSARDTLDAALMEAQIAAARDGRTPTDVVVSVVRGLRNSVGPLASTFMQWVRSKLRRKSDD